MKTLANTLCMFCLSVALTACASNDIRWTEEVKLSNGKIIQVQRHVELTNSGFPVQKRGFNKFHEICYPPMNIHWKSKGGYQPDIFDIVDGKAYMHVALGNCAECAAHGYPSPNALYFVWDNGGWKRIRHDEFPAASEWNLEMGVKGAAGHEGDDMHGLVTLQYKDRPSSLRTDQKRFGWKRLNEDPDYRDACRKCGPSGPNATSAVTESFINDGKNACQP